MGRFKNESKFFSSWIHRKHFPSIGIKCMKKKKKKCFLWPFFTLPLCINTFDYNIDDSHNDNDNDSRRFGGTLSETLSIRTARDEFIGKSMDGRYYITACTGTSCALSHDDSTQYTISFWRNFRFRRRLGHNSGGHSRWFIAI